MIGWIVGSGVKIPYRNFYAREIYFDLHFLCNCTSCRSHLHPDPVRRTIPVHSITIPKALCTPRS
jgi:hypothetical protein